MVMVLYYGMKELMVPIDKAGRIVLPKNIRQDLAIQPGDVLRVTSDGVAVTLTPNRQKAGLVRQGRALVFSTTDDEVLRLETVDNLLAEEREKHAHRGTGRLSGSKSEP